MNKKGFTLIELMGVIIIIGLLIILAIPSITNLLNDEEENISSTMEKVLLQAGELYTQDNIGIYPKTEGNVYCVTLKELVDEEYLGGPIKDPISSNEIDQNKYIKTSIQNGTYNYEITDTCESVNIAYKCKRADISTLHTEECTASSGRCGDAGYTIDGTKGTTTITYGNKTIVEDVLTSGDAFDCDVNGDGTFDSISERFYYVSDLSSNSEYAVLIYYSNTTTGVADNKSSSKIDYDSSNENWHGPVTGITNLPTKIQWKNVSLSNTSRAIITETGTTSTAGGILPTKFSYSGYAARLLTAQELNSACGITVGSANGMELANCEYLLENTAYSTYLRIEGYWLENPRQNNSYDVMDVYSFDYYVIWSRADGALNTGVVGVRPVIEVLKTDIDY